jgi:hypothetical protein
MNAYNTNQQQFTFQQFFQFFGQAAGVVLVKEVSKQGIESV